MTYQATSRRLRALPHLPSRPQNRLVHRQGHHETAQEASYHPHHQLSTLPQAAGTAFWVSISLSHPTLLLLAMEDQPLTGAHLGHQSMKWSLLPSFVEPGMYISQIYFGPRESAPAPQLRCVRGIIPSEASALDSSRRKTSEVQFQHVYLMGPYASPSSTS